MPRLESILTLQFELVAKTGLRVGGRDAGLSIGGDENVIIRDPITRQPYIPGSSLKGKMRSLLERVGGLKQNRPIASVFIHSCGIHSNYQNCLLCRMFGIPAPPVRWFCMTRLRFEDMKLTAESEVELRDAGTELPYTEVKSEAVIDRITSVAMPRTVERVPAGARFGPAQISVFVYTDDKPGEFVDYLLFGMELVEADYLGGMGARGSGRVIFEKITMNRMGFPESALESERATLDKTFDSLADLRAAREKVSSLWANG